MAPIQLTNFGSISPWHKMGGVFLCFFLLIITGFAQDRPTQAQEYDLKAAYIYNITKFIYWETTMPGNEFIIGILGPSPIYAPLLEVVQSKTVNNKKIIIRQYANVEDIQHCNMLFIPENSTLPLDELLDKTRSNKILTISEKEGYGKQGTAINFVTVNDKLKFEVNTKTLEALGLKASAQFLKLTIIIND